MKKTLTINLNNNVFHIDDDAYELLQSYLAEVALHLESEEDKDDIMCDIEARIAEIFDEKMDKNKNVVIFSDVENIIATMGKPSEFTESEDQTYNQANKKHSTNMGNGTGQQATKKTPKKLYRDGEKQLLSGVSSGLATYLNWDTALVRILFVALAFITSGTFILIYLLMWIIIPKAVTTAQKLEMKGEMVNIETLKSNAMDNKEYAQTEEYENTKRNSKGVEILVVLLKVVLVTIAAVIAVVGVMIIASLLVGLIIFTFEPTAITGIDPEFFSYFNSVTPNKVILMIISLLLIIGCPIFALIYWGVNVSSKNKKAKSNTPLWVSLILWVTGIFMFIATGPETIKKMNESFNKLENNNYGSWHWESDDEINTKKENRTVSHFTSIETLGNIEVELSQQPEQTLTVESLIEYLPNVKTEVVDGTLKIYTTDVLIKPKIKVEITTDSLTNITAKGASKITSNSQFTFSKLKLKAEGASKIDLDVNMAQKLDFYLTGASKLEIEGKTDTLNIQGEGASKIDANELISRVVTMELNGASKAEVYATDLFDGEVNGASKISVYGNPHTRKIEKNGGSRINFKNK